MGRASPVTAQELFEYLCQNQNALGYVQAPGNRDLLAFLSERFQDDDKTAIDQTLDELVSLNLISKECHKKIFRVQLLAGDWLKADFPTNKEKSEKEPSKQEEPSSRKFAVFIDYKNISAGMDKNGRRLKYLYPLLQSILEKGKIIFGFVFIPQHFVSRTPVMELSHKHHFEVVVCPRQIDQVITKDKDSVDSKMDSLARRLIEHTDITDVAIFSGDADFHDLATFAWHQQKTVTVVATRESISGRFLEMAEEKIIEVVYC